MANIGATTAFYKVETSLTRANSEVSKSMERLATGRQNANAGDRSSYVAMADTFRLDYVGTKAGIKSASVVKGYLETAMATLDAASGLLSRLQELAVLGANDTNTAADSRAIDAEAEAIADEFHRLLSNAKYKGRDLFVTNADSELVSIGGRGAQMTFGVKKIDYSALYSTSDGSATDTIVEGRIYKVSTDNADLNPFNGGTDPGGDDSTFIASKSGTATTGRVKQLANQLTVAASEGRTTTNTLTSKIEAVQASVNTARVQAGSQYAAIESAVNYTTDLTAQYELGYNTVNDVNFSMETAHLAKNQILQQAATAMLAQANQGQQSLLQLIQG
jgi:flagellin